MKDKRPSEDLFDKYFDIIFEFKLMGKNLKREAKKSENQSKILIKKVNNYILKGDYEQAKIAANDAIFSKNQIRRYTILSGKIDLLVNKLKYAYQNQKLTENMENLIKQLKNSENMTDLVKMTETMENFEKLLDNLEVKNMMMEKVIDGINEDTSIDKEVNQLIEQVALQNGMKLSEDFENIRIGEGKISEKKLKGKMEVDGFSHV